MLKAKNVEGSNRLKYIFIICLAIEKIDNEQDYDSFKRDRKDAYWELDDQTLIWKTILDVSLSSVLVLVTKNS